MTRIRIALTQFQKEALRSPDGAKVLVESMNKEISMQKNEIEGIQENYADLQDKFEKMQDSFHDADKKSSILAGKVQVYIFVEVLKYFTSAICTGLGFYMLGSGDKNGWYLIIASSVVYALLTVIEKLR